MHDAQNNLEILKIIYEISHMVGDKSASSTKEL